MAKDDKLQQGVKQADGTLRQVGPLAFGILVVVLAAANFDKVEVNWVIGSWRTPLIVLIMVSVMLGGVVGYFVGKRAAKAKASDG